MTSTERKRACRLDHPEQSREAERLRAQARRNGYWGTPTLGGPPLRPCASSDSYWRYEATIERFMQRTFWPKYGAGTARMSNEEFRERTGSVFMTKAREVATPPKTTTDTNL